MIFNELVSKIKFTSSLILNFNIPNEQWPKPLHRSKHNKRPPNKPHSENSFFLCLFICSIFIVCLAIINTLRSTPKKSSISTTNNKQSEKHFSNRRFFFSTGVSIIFYFPLNILGQLNKSNFFMLNYKVKN